MNLGDLIFQVGQDDHSFPWHAVEGVLLLRNGEKDTFMTRSIDPVGGDDAKRVWSHIIEDGDHLLSLDVEHESPAFNAVVQGLRKRHNLAIRGGALSRDDAHQRAGDVFERGEDEMHGGGLRARRERGRRQEEGAARVRQTGVRQPMRDVQDERGGKRL